MPTLSNADLQYISVLEAQTGAHAKDVVPTEDSVVFVVEKGELGRVIGKNGATIARLRKLLGKHIDVVEDSQTLAGFLANCFAPAVIKEVKESGDDTRRTVTVHVDAQNKGLAIGRGGATIKKARMLAKRHFNVSELRVV